MDQPLQRASVEEPQDGASTPAINLKDPALYINRELSWLEFNQRVLAQAQDSRHPLLERVKFLAITGTNLDEFFMIRVATTMRRFRAGVEEVAPDGYTTGQQLEAMRSCAHVMLEAVASMWTTLRDLLEQEQVRLLDPSRWTPEIHEYLNGYFSRDICPVLTPLAFDPGHPFPFISNLSKNFAVVVRHAGRIKFARVKVPDVLPRFVALPEALGHGPHTFVFLEDVVRANIHELFPGTQVHGAHLFRIVRDADLEIEDEEDADDLLESVDRSLRQLRRGPISLLQVEANMPARVLDIAR
jgi:polyphosphate kinase